MKVAVREPNQGWMLQEKDGSQQFEHMMQAQIVHQIPARDRLVEQRKGT